MDWQPLVPLGSAVVGGLVVHLLSGRRDRANKRKEQLADLRTDLRAELNLEAVPGNIVHLRITHDEDNGT